MEIIISLDNKKLRHYLENCSKNYHCIYLGEKKEDISQLLNGHSVKEIKTDDYDESFKDRFVESYLDLIGKLGLEYNSIYWWVTGTSAKNQFTSRFFQNLFIFYTMVTKLNEYREMDILIVNPPKEICSSIAKYCRANSINLKMLSSPSPGISKTMKGTLKYGISRAFFIRRTWQRRYISKKYLRKKFADEVQRKGKYYVLRSWFYSRSFNEDNNYRDSFFGILPGYLVKKGKRLLVVAGIIGDYEPIIRKIAGNNDYFIIPQEFFIKYTDPIRAIIDIHFNKIKIKGRIDFDGFDVSYIVQAEIDREFRSGNLFEDYIYHLYTKRLLNVIKVDTFATTYENRPWERICFLTIREYSPQTNIIGYQHAPLSKASLDMRLSKYERNIVPIPDKINTTGKITKDFLEKYGNYGKDILKESCALRFESFPTSEIARRKTSHRILVALRGIRSPAIGLVNFVYRALMDSEQYKIIFRTHPVLPLERFKNELDFHISSCNNFSISTSTSVKQELQEADMVIYEGTAMAIEALAMGTPVIYIALNEITSPDPLFQCEHFKYTVDREEDLPKTIEAIYQLTDDEYYNQQRMAVKYVKDYAYEITEERLGEFIV